MDRFADVTMIFLRQLEYQNAELCNDIVQKQIDPAGERRRVVVIDLWWNPAF